MKAFNKLSAVLLLSAGAFCHQALADNAVFTAMDDPSTAKKPFEGSASAGYLAQTGKHHQFIIDRANQYDLVHRINGLQLVG